MEREARRRCGAAAIRCRGEPMRLSICRCPACKRRTPRTIDDGNRVPWFFCPACGTTLRYELEIRPAMVSVAVGGFADPTFPAPTVEVHDERRCVWLPDFGLPREG